MKFPSVVRLEPSGICNFACSHCVGRLRPNSRGLLSVELFDKIMVDFWIFLKNVGMILKHSSLNPKR